MIENLANDLNTIEIRQKKQNILIEILYKELEEIHFKKNYLKFLFCPTKDLFAFVRPEVVQQILQFVDLKTFLQFRLVNRRCNLIIKIISPLKANQIDGQVKLLITDFENQSLLYEQEQVSAADRKLIHLNLVQLDKAYQDLEQVSKVQITEIRCLSKPPSAVERVCYYLLVLMNRDDQQNLWKESQNLLSEPDFLEKILQTDPILITEEQLAKFVSFDQLTALQVQKCSFAAFRLQQFIKALIDVRKSRKYMLYSSVEMLKQKIYHQKKAIENLYQFSNK